ncbi:hypothetical protein AVEN_249182-1 [Araneus ventricosus]|uniref:Uncharacterized protein n=1 Tax=Araneus ventricosus TaxID=182803 RepID=A0A4Y2VPX0_ARAVE|nr:hypothetical protein AVEN_249182-1 [Araneus ventricosus]
MRDGGRRPMMTYLDVINFQFKQILEIRRVVVAGELSKGFVDSNIGIPLPDYLSRLQELMRALKPSGSVHHGLKAVYMPKDLQTCSHVFGKRGPIKKGFGNTI